MNARFRVRGKWRAANRVPTALGVLLALLAAALIAAPPVAAVNEFTPTAPMAVARTDATASVLTVAPNAGKVLIAGGANSGGALASKTLYDPVARTFGGNSMAMDQGRTKATASVLPDGNVLIAGGMTSTSTALNNAELYLSAGDAFTPLTPTMAVARIGATASVLPDGPNAGTNAGKVLIVGGRDDSGPLASAELFDPAGFGSFTATGLMAVARYGATASVLTVGLNAGKVLIAGGSGDSSAELYDPASGTFSPTGPMAVARYGATASVLTVGLNAGKVLIAGGTDASYAPVASAELYDPASGTFTATGSMATARSGATASVLTLGSPAGKVLISGGTSASAPLASAELYDPASPGSFSTAGSMNDARFGATASVMSDGAVLMAGGLGSAGALMSAETFFNSDVSAPAATTVAATSVSDTGAVLNGSVTPNGAATTASFQYGTDPALASGTTTVAATQSPVAGSAGATAVSVSLTGLSTGTTYYFRTIANNGVGGNQYGSILSFTPTGGPTATTAAAGTLTYNSAVLNGSVTPNGAATTASFQYGTDSGLASGTTTVAATQSPVAGSAGPTAVSVSLTGLSTGTTYYFRTIANNGVGGNQYGSILSFTPTGGPTATTAAAGTLTHNAAVLNGSVTPNGTATAASFQYGTDSGLASGTTTVAATPSPVAGSAGPTAVSAPLTGLTTYATYYFRAVANNGVGGDQLGSILSFTLSPAAPTVATVAASAVTGNAAVLNGSVTPNGAATSVSFKYGTVASLIGGDTQLVPATQSLVAGTAGPTAVSLSLTGLTAGTPYYFRVVADNNTGGAQSGTILSFTPAVVAPTAPTVSTSYVDAGERSGARLHGMVSANGATTAISFQYGLDPALATGTTTVPADTASIGPATSNWDASVGVLGLTSGTRYYYRVVANNGVGGDQNGSIEFFTTDSDPTVVTKDATSVGQRSARLYGTVALNGSHPLAVKFQYGTDETLAGGATEATATQSPVSRAGSVTTWVDKEISGLRPGTTYFYRVAADGNERDGTTYGQMMSFTTLPPDPLPPPPPPPPPLPGILAQLCPTGSCAGVDLHGVNLNGVNLAGVNLAGVNLVGANLSGANLDGANLGGANLTGAELGGASLVGTFMQYAELAHATMTGVDLTGAVMDGANMFGANLSEAIMANTSLAFAIMVGANLTGCVIMGAIFAGADLLNVLLKNTSISKALFSVAKDLLSAALSALSKRSLRASKTGRVVANLAGADLSGAKLSKVDLTKVNLTKADLSNTKLTKVNLSKANLTNADLSGAKLSKVNLTNAKLSNTNFSDVKLSNVKLTNVDLSKVNPAGALATAQARRRRVTSI